MGNYSSRSAIQAWDCRLGMLTRFFRLSLAPSRKAAGWGWPSAVPLSNRMAAGCGPPPIRGEGQLFASPCQAMQRSQHWSYKDVFSDVEHEAGHDNITDTKVEAKPCTILMPNRLRTVPVPNFRRVFRTPGEGHSSAALLPFCLSPDKLANGSFNPFPRSH